MMLFTTCSHCREEIRIKPTEHSRFDLSREKGANEFSTKCSECGRGNKVHVNDVRAIESKKRLFIIIAIILFLSVLALSIFEKMGFWVISAAPLSAIGIFYWNEKKSVHTFNKHLLKR